MAKHPGGKFGEAMDAADRVLDGVDKGMDELFGTGIGQFRSFTRETTKVKRTESTKIRLTLSKAQAEAAILRGFARFKTKNTEIELIISDK